jgi:FtsP/CotA-like multicopper oxidase with cupredoxin domain
MVNPEPRIGRRALLAGIAGGGLALAGGFGVRRLTDHGAAGMGHGDAVTLDRAAIARVEAARARSGRTRAVDLVARRSQVDLGGRVVTAFTYGGVLPGALLRFSAGDLVQARIRNELDQETSVHWHGLAIRHDADGVPGVTGPAIAPGTGAVVEFVVPDPGTYWLHPHSGLQLDWGLHAPVIVDDPNEKGDYDQELVVVLDDWTVGLGRTPEQLLADLVAGGGSMGGMGGMGGMWGVSHGTMGGSDGAGRAGGMSDAGDVDYPAYLANGLLPEAAATVAARPGQRVRVRMINAAADTTFDVALGGHRMTLTHTDGFAVLPVTVDTLRIGMGERYDVIVTLADGCVPADRGTGRQGSDPRPAPGPDRGCADTGYRGEAGRNGRAAARAGRAGPGGRRAPAGPVARHRAGPGPGRRHDLLPMDHQRSDLRRHGPAAGA